MPGLFGVVGSTPQLREQLADSFASIWPASHILRGADHVLGAHSFGSTPALASLPDGPLIAVDGELETYQRFERWLARHALPGADQSGALSTLRESTVGSVVAVDSARRELTISTDASGAFPLYYTRIGDGLAFSTLARPLAELTRAETNHHAVRQFLRQAWVVGPETVFAGISRLLPGQTLQFEQGCESRITEGTRAWIRDLEGSESDFMDLLWQSLADSARSALQSGPSVLMMSGGWDSRTLLAALPHGASHVTCYSHGDLQSRELQLVRELSDLASVACQLEPLDDRMFDPTLLTDGFRRTESISFPHWHLAGQLLAAAGTRSISAGILGEILGGHYGPAMLGSNLARARALFSSLIHPTSTDPFGGKLNPRDMLYRTAATRPWYLKRDYATSLANEVEHYNAAVDSELSRHSCRGVSDPSALVESFVSEQRGSQYIAAQLRSCRAHVDISLPYASPAALLATTRLPLARRIHNRMNRKLLLKYAPGFLESPMAATLLPASSPILMQEGSRVVRKIGAEMLKRARRTLSPTAQPPRLGWVNFEFLGSSPSLHELVDTLELPFWDRERMARMLGLLVNDSAGSRAHPVFDQLMKIKTLDSLLSTDPK